MLTRDELIVGQIGLFNLGKVTNIGGKLVAGGIR